MTPQMLSRFDRHCARISRSLDKKAHQLVFNDVAINLGRGKHSIAVVAPPTRIQRRYARSHSSTVPASELRGEPWKNLLEYPARAAWRVSDPPLRAVALDHMQQSMLQQRNSHLSRKQLKQIHQTSLVTMHQSLAERRERERRRAFYGKEYKKDDMKRDAKVHPVLYGPEETYATLQFRLYPNFAIAKRVLLECKSLLGRDAFKPKRVIDFGVGLGSASAAALDVWKDSVEWIHGIDASQTMREGAKQFLEGYASKSKLDDFSSSLPSSLSTDDAPTRVTFSAHLSVEASVPSFDLTLFSYTATELTHGASILASAAALWEKLLPNGVFVMIEPGTPDGFMNIRTVRNMLLDCCPPNQGVVGEVECHIIAPCTHSGKCPMLQYQPRRAHKSSSFTDEDYKTGIQDEDHDDADDHDNADDSLEENEDKEAESTRKGFCSFVQTMPGMGHAISKGEKFSYLVAQKRIQGEFMEPQHQFHGVSVARLLRDSQSASRHDRRNTLQAASDLEAHFLESDDDDLGLELLRGDANRSSFGRIIHAPIKRKGHVLIECCSSPGQLVRHSISKSMSQSSPGIYAAARKSRWGGYWPSEPALDRKTPN